MRETIRILLVDDHTLVREGVRLLLTTRQDFQVVGEAANGAAAVRLALELAPDIVLLDLRMPELDGIGALEQIRCHRPEIKVVVLSMYDDETLFFQALRLGAAGFILKGASSTELVAALQAVSEGHVYLSPPMTSILVGDFLQGWRPILREDNRPPDTLSTREREVLQRLAEGQTNAEIASALVISPSTVQTHRSRLLEKLGLKTRSDLVKYAIRHGLVQLG